jgi:maspardin
MKKIGVSLGILAIVIAAIFLWPVPKKNFEDLAGKVDPATRQSLLAFRANHPIKAVQVDKLEWQYVEFGSGEKTILFLHGMTGADDIWWQQMEALSQQVRVISVTYPPADTLQAMSDGILHILDTEGVESVYVVGTSLGGYFVQYLVANHPDRIDKAVLANTFPPNDILRQKNEGLIKVLPILPNWLVMRVLRGSIVDSVYPASGNSELVLAYMLEQVSGRMSKAQVRARAQAVIEPFAPPDFERLGIPVMIIEADNDPLVEEALRQQLVATYPTAQVHTLHAVGHFPYLNRPDEYTRMLLDFFGD